MALNNEEKDSLLEEAGLAGQASINFPSSRFSPIAAYHRATRPMRKMVWLAAAVLMFILLQFSFFGRAPNATNRALGKNYAFATFLSTDTVETDEAKMEEDNYFVATRLLVYQLLHNPKTRTKHGYPVIVLVTESVSPAKRARLEKDGAIIREARPLDAGWLWSYRKNWQSNILKLRLWQFDEYDLISYIDSDGILFDCMDGIFEDPAVAVQHTKNMTEQLHPKEAEMPKDYIFGSYPEINMMHKFPPQPPHDFGDGKGWNLNAGFLVFRPDQKMFEYYTSMLTISPEANGGEALFKNDAMEQSLLNYAHRQDGNMPWQRVADGWTVHWPTGGDIAWNGTKSIHEKWWSPIQGNIKPLLTEHVGRMRGFYEALEQLHLEGRKMKYPRMI